LFRAILLATYIERNDLYFDDLRFSVYLDEGAEQKVFFYSEESKVVKLNDAIFYVNWSQYFESLIVHNILFPETKYELLGFVKVNEILYSAISQDYIESTEKTKLDHVKAYMSSKGFTIKKKNDYIHPDYGIIIEDLHEENVLIKDDTLFFIDTVIYLK
jgi:Serine/Threonine/Tyrosine Kinase found in polyvalent proteins